MLVVFALLGAFGTRSTQGRVRIRAFGGPQRIVHNGLDAAQIFSEVRWVVICFFEPNGATAQWSCGPFVHTADPTYQVDSQLDMRIQSNIAGADFVATIPSDRTDVMGGDPLALVQAQSTRNGAALVGLTVSYLSSQYSTLATGDYSLTVIGTIAAN